MKIITTLFMAGFLCICIPAYAQGKVLGLLELRNAVLSEDKILLKSAAYSDVPSGATFATTDIYYEAIFHAAQKLGDFGRAEELVKAWEIAGTGSNLPKTFRFQILARATGTALEEAVRLGIELIERSNSGFPDTKIHERHELANLYLIVGEFAKADALLGEAEIILRDDLAKVGLRGNWAYWVPYTKSKFFRTRCIQNILLYQFGKAEAFCLQANEMIENALKNKDVTPPCQNELLHLPLLV